MSQAESTAPITASPFEVTVPDIETPGTLPDDGVPDDLHPPLVAVGDVLVGGLLFVQFTSALGLAMAAIGVVVLCALVYGTLVDSSP